MKLPLEPVIMYFLNGETRENFPNLHSGKSDIPFYSNSFSYKTLGNSTLCVPHVLMAGESDTTLEAQGKGDPSLPRASSKAASKAHVTQN